MTKGRYIKLNKHTKIDKVFNAFGIILLLISFVSLGIFSYALFKINVAPVKYLIAGYTIIFVIFSMLIWIILGRTHKLMKVMAFIITITISAFLGYSTTHLNNTYAFLNNTQVKEYNTLNYSVVVLKTSPYKNIENLNGKTISFLEDDYKDEVREEIYNNISYTELLVDDFGYLPDYLLKGTVDAICIEDSYLNLIEEEVTDFKESTEKIYTFEVSIKSHQEETENIDVKDKPFILYISGIDQYGNVNNVRGRSDVNQIVIVNPKTNHILLVNTPRDYYVQLSGTTGLKDKLTHAGIYGIEKSINTLEELYNIDINHYMRVNFDTLIKVVDEIGGIDIYSDAAFIPYTNQSVYVNKGWNHMDGTLALAYARERYAYTTGDHHRGANQQQVITAIINKVTKSHVLVSKYNGILNTLNGTFQTDMKVDMITSFIKYQLDKMPSWQIESIAVTGYNSSNYTNSIGYGEQVFVMEPDYNSVSKARKRIEEVLNER